MRTPIRPFLVAAVVTLSSSHETPGATILVPENQPTIQACVAAASAGDTCSVAPGVYLETPPAGVVQGVTASVIVNKDITIRSRELYQAILDGIDRSTWFFIIQGNVHIEGFVIQNVGAGVASRGNTTRFVQWSASNLIVRNSNHGLGIDDDFSTSPFGSSATVSSIVVDGTGLCYWTNNAHDFDVRNSIAAHCAVGFEGCDHDSFLFSYSIVFDVGVTDMD